jgi:proton-translocating NAD(P)+ transhydrogenase subunit alpha
MKIGVAKERRPHERRVAATPDSVKRLAGQGHEILVETGAGAMSAFPDAAYEAAGAHIAAREAVFGDADILLKVRRPLGPGEGEVDEMALLRRDGALLGMLAPLQHKDQVAAYAAAGVTAFAMELVPRITRAQTMDVLSSQANLAGYKAVLDAAHAFGRAFPMMMTAAGTVAPARVLVMGAGVAGLQAIATARRLGAIVSATDVRLAAKEQVESLGASFLVVDLEAMKQMETAGGYAREMGEDFAKRQREHVAEALRKTDIVITTALVPGRRAPVLITREMVAAMRPGSVIVDLAVEQGGNVEGAEFAKDVVTANGVTIVGPANLPSEIAVDASALYARNLAAFLALVIDADKRLAVNTGDEIVKAALLTQGGAVVNPQLAGAG